MFSVVPAKAGTHSELARAYALWIPAFAGKTEGLTMLQIIVAEKVPRLIRFFKNWERVVKANPCVGSLLSNTDSYSCGLITTFPVTFRAAMSCSANGVSASL